MQDLTDPDTTFDVRVSGGEPPPRPEFIPYVPDKQHDYVRLIVTVGLLLMLGWVVV